MVSADGSTIQLVCPSRLKISRKTFVIFGTNLAAPQENVMRVVHSIYPRLICSRLKIAQGAFFLALKFERDQPLNFGPANRRLWLTLLSEGGRVYVNTLGSAGSSGHHDGPWNRILLPLLENPLKIIIAGEPGSDTRWLEMHL